MDIVNQENTLPALQSKRGLESKIGREDITIPRAKLLQALSPEVTEDNATLRSGQLINNITREELPTEFVPIIYTASWTRFNPRDSKDPAFDPDFPAGALIWRSTDPEDERVIADGKWGENGEKPLAGKAHDFLAYFPGVPMPVVISFRNSSFKAGKSLLSLVAFMPGDIWTRKYKLVVEKTENEKGKFFVLAVRTAGVSTPEENAQAENWYNLLKNTEYKVHEDNEEE